MKTKMTPHKVRQNYLKYLKRHQKRQSILRGVVKAHGHLVPFDISRRTRAAKKSAQLEPPDNPYRKGSLYAAVYAVLLDHMAEGISRWELVRKVKTIAKNRSEKQIKWAVSIVSSISIGPDNCSRHPSAHGDYYIVKTNDHLRLCLDKIQPEVA